MAFSLIFKNVYQTPELLDNLSTEINSIAKRAIYLKVGADGVLIEIPFNGNENLKRERVIDILEKPFIGIEAETTAENLCGSLPEKGFFIGLNFDGSVKRNDVIVFIRSGFQYPFCLQLMGNTGYAIFVNDKDKNNMLRFLQMHPKSIKKYDVTQAIDFKIYHKQKGYKY